MTRSQYHLDQIRMIIYMNNYDKPVLGFGAVKSWTVTNVVHLSCFYLFATQAQYLFRLS